MLHTLPVSAAPSVPSSATFLGVRADLDGILPTSSVKAKTTQWSSGTGGAEEDEVKRLVGCGLLRAVVDLVLWDRSLIACPTNIARVAALERLFTSGLGNTDEIGASAGESVDGPNGGSQGQRQVKQNHLKQTSKSLSFGAKVKAV